MTLPHAPRSGEGSCMILAGNPTLSLSHFRLLVPAESTQLCLYAPGLSGPYPITAVVSCTFDHSYLDEQPSLYPLAHLLRQWREPTPLILNLPDWYSIIATFAQSYFSSLRLVPSIHVHDLHYSHATLLLQYLYAILLQTLPWAGDAGAVNSVTQRFLTLVNQHGHTAKSPTFYANELLISVSALRKHCQSTLGQPPSAVIQQRRLKAARQWLIDTTLPIGDIADRLGYNGHAYFSEHFKQHTGINPSEYRLRYATTR